jgi:hypothetical protein
MVWTTKESVFHSYQELIFPLLHTFKTVCGVHSVSRAMGTGNFPQKFNGCSLKLIVYLHVVSKLMRGVIFPLSHTSLWHGAYLSTASTSLFLAYFHYFEEKKNIDLCDLHPVWVSVYLCISSISFWMPVLLLRHCEILNIVAYLLKASTVKPEKQPL